MRSPLLKLFYLLPLSINTLLKNRKQGEEFLWIKSTVHFDCNLIPQVKEGCLEIEGGLSRELYYASDLGSQLFSCPYRGLASVKILSR